MEYTSERGHSLRTARSMTLGMYADGLKAVGEPIDLTATVTCSL